MKKRIRGIVFIIICVVIFTSIAIYTYFGGIDIEKTVDTEEFALYVQKTEEMEIPEQAQIIALGEATHGNVEFQELKLQILKMLVEKNGVRAFALEGDYGGCEVVNRYIHGSGSSAQEAVNAIGFDIYKTKEMSELITWMRNYNENADEGEDLCFYGFDMQRYGYNYKFLMETASGLGVNIDRLSALWNYETDDLSDDNNIAQRREVYEDIKEQLLLIDNEKSKQAVHFADILLQNISLGEVMESSADMTILRDKLMAENVMWILSQEQARGNNSIFISGHNGHIKKSGNYGTQGKVMGAFLSEKMGDNYYAIGTDFYKTTCNLPKEKSILRENHSFYSHNPLAKAAKKCGYDISWLDFSKVDSDSKINKLIMSDITMGSLGEYYNRFYMRFFPRSYRIKAIPYQLYDGMILVTQAHPIEISE